MKVLIATSKYHPYYSGGGEYSVKLLAESLLQHSEIETSVITVCDKESKEDVNGVSVLRIRPRNSYWSYNAKRQSQMKKMLWHLVEVYNPRMKEVARLIAEEIKPDVVHFRNIEDFSPSILRYLWKLRIPTIQTLNSYTMIEPKGTLYRESRARRASMRIWQMAFMGKKVLSNYATAVVGVSQAVLNEHTERGYFRNAKRYVVQTRLPLKDSVSTEVSSERSETTFGYIGNFLETKGVLPMIRAFRNSGNENSRLVLAGEYSNPYGYACRNEADADSRVKFLGRVKQEEFYSAIDAVIIPSVWKEPFPRVLIEANSFGIPAIASSNGGTKEGIVQNHTGIVFDTFPSLSEHIDRLSNPNGELFRMKKNLTESLRDVRTDESEAYLSIYKNICGVVERNVNADLG